ncbi:FecR family protein [Pedobacter frigoris]|uniref:FecR family protein n=1 Tax=Pedobacter frigoris TaxID=2571272 RepID=UPI00292ED1D5|nr:FecR domain-containing protein [Pedobacter frigoris]
MDNEIIKLIIKYLNNQCSKDELEKVLGIIETGIHQDEWEFVLTEEASTLANSNRGSEMPVHETTAWYKKIQDTIAERSSKTVSLPRRNSYWKKIAAAAIILITLSVGSFYYFSRPSISPTLANDIAPGGNRAILTLANGKKVILTDAKNGELATQSDVVITKLADGKIVYSVKSGKPTDSKPNTVETPKGGQYEVILPDGTSVLLNAASELTFPTSFAHAKERRVKLKGEAYFMVSKVTVKGKTAKTRMPFIVVTDRAEIEVLGTHFNINSYADEPVSKTTLVEGSVAVRGSGFTKILTPGNQATIGTGGLTVTEANIDEVLAWKNGYFIFDSEDIESVMRRISRWYDVDVIYEGKIPNDRFGGTVSRFSNVSKVLSKLELTNKVHFRIEERRIIVTR